MFRFYSKGDNRITIIAEQTDNCLHVAVARCSNKDQFIKAKGRKIAEGRLNKNKLYTTINNFNPTINNFVYYAECIVNEIKGMKSNFSLIENNYRDFVPLIDVQHV